ncbi:MAG TPA: DUF4199 domain-containing protein [Flavobacterium sp.]|jgi:hypothetical protein
MKKTVLTYGLIAGAIVSAWLMIAMQIGHENMDGDMGMFYGYTAMLVAFAFIFVAVKSDRKENGEIISFGKAFRIGLYITLIASTLYVLAWLVTYYFFIPDFMDKYVASAIEQLRANGASAAEIANERAEMSQYIEWYKNPLFVVLLTYMEILPVGLVLSVIAAAILKRKEAGSAVYN